MNKSWTPYARPLTVHQSRSGPSLVRKPTHEKHRPSTPAERMKIKEERRCLCSVPNAEFEKERKRNRYAREQRKGRSASMMLAGLQYTSFTRLLASTLLVLGSETDEQSLWGCVGQCPRGAGRRLEELGTLVTRGRRELGYPGNHASCIA